MTSRHAPERHYLAFTAWPAQDQTIWAKLTEPGPTVLDDRGAFADSRPRTNATRRQHYSHWLNHITLNHPDLLPLMPVARIRLDTLAEWLAILDRTVAPYTRLRRAVDLLGIARAMDPGGDWRFLQRAVRSLAARAVPSRNKEPRIRPSALLVELGFALMREATTLPMRRRARAATLHRDGLTIALLALRPMRLRNLTGLELGRTLHHGPTGWCITIPADETKTHRAIEVGWPPSLVDALAIYLARHRPVLLHGGSTKALFIGTGARRTHHPPGNHPSDAGSARRSDQPPSLPRLCRHHPRHRGSRTRWGGRDHPRSHLQPHHPQTLHSGQHPRSQPSSSGRRRGSAAARR
jgi:integrase/recombinase XerD